MAAQTGLIPKVRYNNTVQSQVYAGTGNGTLVAGAPAVGTPVEVFTVLATSATNFTVTGTVSGAQPAATVGVAYNSGEINFLITAGGVAFVAGDRFTITVGVDLLWTFPMKIWNLREKTFGGYGKASTGIPESMLIRRERHLLTSLTVFETELQATKDWLEFVTDNAAAFDFWLNKLDDNTRYTVYLDKPHMTDDVDFVRHDSYPAAWSIDIDITTVNNNRFTTTIFS